MGESAFSGTIKDGVGQIGLIKAGEGTLVLSGNNTYSGPTIIRDGTLVVKGGNASSIGVEVGATLGGSGSLGSVTVHDGGILAPLKRTSEGDLHQWT